MKETAFNLKDTFNEAYFRKSSPPQPQSTLLLICEQAVHRNETTKLKNPYSTVTIEKNMTHVDRQFFLSRRHI